MSAFTQDNGPGYGYSGSAVAGLTKLIEAFNSLSSKLNTHIEATAPTDAAVHGIKTALDALKAELNAAIQQRATINSVQEIRAELDDYATKQALSNAQQSLNTLIAQKADSSDVETKVDKTEYHALESLTQNIQNQLEQLNAAWDAFNTKYDASTEDRVLFNSIVATTKTFLGAFNARKMIDFTEWKEVNAQFAGTGSATDTSTNGLYVLGKLSDNWSHQPNAPQQSSFKAARAFIKYENTKPFDAIVDMTCTKVSSGWLGSIRAQVSKEKNKWSGMQFHLVHGTDKEGVSSIYLCISADGLAKDAFNSSALNFFVAGINFIPLDEDSAKRVQIVDACACTSTVSDDTENSYVMSNITATSVLTDKLLDAEDEKLLEVVTAIDDITREKYKVLYIGDAEKQPFKDIVFTQKPSFYSNQSLQYFVTDKDIEEIFPVGGMIRWLDDVEVPDGWHRTDGSSIDPSYTLLRKRIHSDAYPVEENTIIRCTLSEVEKSKWRHKHIANLMQLNEKLQTEIDRSSEKDVKHDEGIAENAENIITETARATAAETGLDEKITAETERATEAETNLSTAITAETERATAAETELNEKVTGLDERTSAVEETTTALASTIPYTLLLFHNTLPSATPIENGAVIANEQCAAVIENGVVKKAEVQEDGNIIWHDTGRTIPENDIPTQVTISLIFNNIPEEDKAEIDGKKIDAPKHTPYNNIRFTPNLFVYSLEDAAVYKLETIDEEGNITWSKVDIVETVNVPVYAEMSDEDKAEVDGKLVNLPKLSPYHNTFLNIGMAAVSLNSSIFSLYTVTGIEDDGTVQWEYVRDIVPVNL